MVFLCLMEMTDTMCKRLVRGSPTKSLRSWQILWWFRDFDACMHLAGDPLRGFTSLRRWHFVCMFHCSDPYMHLTGDWSELTHTWRANPPNGKCRFVKRTVTPWMMNMWILRSSRVVSSQVCRLVCECWKVVLHNVWLFLSSLVGLGDSCETYCERMIVMASVALYSLQYLGKACGIGCEWMMVVGVFSTWC